MSNFMNKMSIPTAITEHSKFDLDCQHITSGTWFGLQPIYCKEMVPGERISINAETFARLNPMPVPTYGRARIQTRAMFVPAKTCWRAFDNFIVDTVKIGSDGNYNSTAIPQHVPSISNFDLMKAVMYSVGSNASSPTFIYPAGGTSYDLDLTAFNGMSQFPLITSNHYNYTRIGRQMIKNLESLGYKIMFVPFGSPATEPATNPVYSAMPLLAMLRVYCDFYFPNQYTNYYAYDRAMSLLNYDMSGSVLQLTPSDITFILMFTAYTMYNSDYFTVQWDVPNQPTAGTVSGDYKIVNLDTASTLYGVSSSYGTVYNNVESGYVSNNSGNANATTNRIGGANAPFIVPTVLGSTTSGATVASPTPISQYLIHSLHFLTDFLHRNQLAGSKVADRWLARYGKSLKPSQLDRSIYLGANYQDVQIGDVMSTSDTAAQGGEQLGSYCGQGKSYGSGTFEYETDEYGFLMVFSSIVPSVAYTQGIDRNLFHVYRSDHWIPELENIGVQATKAIELYCPQAYITAFAGIDEGVFGFIPRYAEYKSGHCKDRLTGNFRLNSINGAIPGTLVGFNAADSWHLNRLFDNTDFPNGTSDIVHNFDFISGLADFRQYDRIFYNFVDDDKEAPAPDNFTLIHNFEVTSYSPMKKLFDEYDWNESDRGKEITMDVNGVNMN